MFFDDFSDFPRLAKKTNFSIFAVEPSKAKLEFKKAFHTRALFLEPDEKTGSISIEAVRNFASLAEVKDSTDRFFIVLFAETMNEPAENAFLKSLEEPKPHHHFVLITETPSALLPTVLSRAQIFYLKKSNLLNEPVEANEKVKSLAKRLITADAKELLVLADEITKKKDAARPLALAVVSTAIEILYKSYFATEKEKFLQKLPNLLTLYDNLAQNGHVKLHIVADML